MRKIIAQIINELSKDDFFADFTLRKWDSSFVLTSPDGWKSIYFDNWVNIMYNNFLIVCPTYKVRYHILSKWFEKFSFKSIKDQRRSYSYAFNGSMIANNAISHFIFDLDGIGFESEFNKMRQEIIECTTLFLNEYSTLPKLYEKIIEPILLGETELPDVGADWIFDDLTLCRIINPDNYDKLKVIIRAHIEWMYSRKEPNIISYYNRLDEIFSYLESLKF